MNLYFLSEGFSESGDPSCTIMQNWARVEVIFSISLLYLNVFGYWDVFGVFFHTALRYVCALFTIGRTRRSDLNR